jgi:hypothetical protein
VSKLLGRTVAGTGFSGDGQCFFHALSLAITGIVSQSLVYRSLICSEIYNNFDFYEDQLKQF